MTMLTPESAKEFEDARKQAFIEEWLNFFTGRPNDLLSFEEVRQNLRLQDSAYKGLHEIEVDKIVGSVGRYRDFTRTFHPKNDEMEARWRHVDEVVHELGLPPIEVYKIGDVYFVRDGNHRVSIARAHDAKTIEAYVIEYKTSVPIEKDDDLDDILLKTEHTEFFAKTRLDQIRPEQTVEFTEPGRYRLVLEHIAFHKYLKETEAGHQIAYEEAVASWYDNVYIPVVEKIRASNVLRDFPGRTEADLYAWLLLHRAAFEQEIKALGYVPTEDLIEKIKRERATNPFARLMGFLRSRLDLHSLSLKVERDKFLQDTHLDGIKPNHNLKFTEAGCYDLTRKHINTHKFLKEAELGGPIAYEEAVAGWYDNVYMPLIQLIREHNLQQEFPKNTEADLYLWLISRREQLEAERCALGQIPNEEIIKELEEKVPSNPLERFVQQLKNVSVFDI
jgi:hypothetical protein